MKKETKEIYHHITNEKMQAILKIQSFILYQINNFFHKNGFIEIPPVIIAPITDPLSHELYEAQIKYEGQKLQLTKSMIFHKQATLMSKGIDKIFTVSPNVRLEKSFQAKPRHLIEFQQIDFEIKNATKKDVFNFMEKLLVFLLFSVKKNCSKELKILERKIPNFKTPLPKFKTYQVEEKYGKNYEDYLSKNMSSPFWLESFYREFYDKEDPKKRGRFINYDLIYPEGFGEGLSGGEREYDYNEIKRKIKERNISFQPYQIYLDLSQNKKIPRTAGGGFGLQRLLRYLTGIKKIEDVVLFPRSPRKKIIF